MEEERANIMDTIDDIEKRKHKRFEAREGCFVVVWPDFSKQGQIIDISKGGLAFRYIADEEEKISDGAELDILLQDISFYLERVPFRTVYDIEIQNQSTFIPLKMRRMGVEFGELTPNQTALLDYFINNHTVNGNQLKQFTKETSGTKNYAISYGSR
jgi:hypothetical protein